MNVRGDAKFAPRGRTGGDGWKKQDADRLWGSDVCILFRVSSLLPKAGAPESVDDVEAGVFAQAFGDDDAFGGLVVLKQRGHDSREGEGGAIEGVAEACLLVLAAVAAFQTVGLVCLEVGDGRNLKPTALCGGVDLEVEGDGRGEAHVAAAETEDMPGKTDFFEKALDMVFHLFESGIGVLGLFDADNLDLVELMETVESADILAVGAGLATEACGVGAVLYREFVGGNDDVAVNVGDGNFGGRDEVEFVLIDEIHLAFLVGELACAVAGGFVHDVGGLYLKIAGLACLVEKELDEGALQTGALADVDGETGTGDLHTEVEIDDVVFLCEFPVGECVGGKVGHRAAGLLDNIVGCGQAFGHSVAGDVGYAEEDVADGVFGRAQTIGDFFLLGLDFSHFLLGFLGLVAVAFLHQTSYRVCIFLKFGGESVVLVLEATALVVKVNHVVDSLLSVKAFDGEARDDALGILFYLLKS